MAPPKSSDDPRLQSEPWDDQSTTATKPASNADILDADLKDPLQPPNAAFTTSRTQAWPTTHRHTTSDPQSLVKRLPSASYSPRPAPASDEAEHRRALQKAERVWVENPKKRVIATWMADAVYGESVPYDIIGAGMRKDLWLQAKAENQHVRNPGCWCEQDHDERIIGDGTFGICCAKYLFPGSPGP
jgi:hypothetical protein